VSINQRIAFYGGEVIYNFLKKYGEEYANSSWLPQESEGQENFSVANLKVNLISAQQCFYPGSYDILVIDSEEKLNSEEVKNLELSGTRVILVHSLILRYLSIPVTIITGENGKSSIVDFLSEIFQADNQKNFEFLKLCDLESLQIDKKNCKHLFINVSFNNLNCVPVDLVENLVVSSLGSKNIPIQNSPLGDAFNESKLSSFLKTLEVKTSLFLPYSLELKDLLIDRENLFWFNDCLEREINEDQVADEEKSYDSQVNFCSWFKKPHLVIKTLERTIQFNCSMFRARGRHSLYNLSKAYMIAMKFGVRDESLYHVLDQSKSSRGKVSFYKRINSVAFYNDGHSKTPESLDAALNSFENPIVLIAGGKISNFEYADLKKSIRRRVKYLLLVGEAKESLNRVIGDSTETFIIGTLEEAVMIAYQKSRSGDIVLYSPGCPPQSVWGSSDPLKERGEFYMKTIGKITRPKKVTAYL